MGNRILLILILIVAGCMSSDRRKTFLENDIKELVRDADNYFEVGDYERACKTYQKALSDYRVLVLGTEDKLALRSFKLDTLEINNKMEVARIGSLIK